MKKAIVFGVVALMSLSFAKYDRPRGLNLGDAAPDFSGMDQNGKEIRLKAELKKGALVIVFYRGQWCPYCNKQLSALQDSLPFIEAKGANLIAVSPETPENISKTVEKTKAGYSVVSDNGLKIVKAYDVNYEVDQSMIKKLTGYGIDLGKSNGNNGNHLPVPTVYVISKEGKVIYKSFNEDPSKRPSVKEIIAAL